MINREDAKRWAVVVAVPVVAYVTGFVALPRPSGVAAEQREFDRSKLGNAVTTTPTTPGSVVEITLGSTLVLRGADLPPTSLSRGARLPIALHFAVPGGNVSGAEGDWQVFLHIDSENGSYRIHGDHWPVRGLYKTPFWRPGEFIVDKWEGTVPMDAPAGIYDVYAGLYRGDDRLEVTAGNRQRSPSGGLVVDADDRVRVGQVTIE